VLLNNSMSYTELCFDIDRCVSGLLICFEPSFHTKMGLGG
jgi:hypothetical protein